MTHYGKLIRLATICDWTRQIKSSKCRRGRTLCEHKHSSGARAMQDKTNKETPSAPRAQEPGLVSRGVGEPAPTPRNDKFADTVRRDRRRSDLRDIADLAWGAAGFMAPFAVAAAFVVLSEIGMGGTVAFLFLTPILVVVPIYGAMRLTGLPLFGPFAETRRTLSPAHKPSVAGLARNSLLPRFAAAVKRTATRVRASLRPTAHPFEVD